MRPLALVGLILSLALVGLAVFNTGEAARARREAQDNALDGAVGSVVGRVAGSERQMNSVAAEMLVNPAVSALLLAPSSPYGRGRLTAAQRRADTAIAARALGAFEQAALVRVSSACLDDARGAQLACGPAAGGVVFPPLLGERFAALARETLTGATTPAFVSPVTRRRASAFLLPLRVATRLVGLIHFDMSRETILQSNLLAQEVPGVSVGFTVFAHGRGEAPGAVSVTTSRRWTVAGAHRRLIADLQVSVGGSARTLAIAATATAAEPDFLNSWSPGRLAVLVLATLGLGASLCGLLGASRRTKRELATDPLTRLRNRRALMQDLAGVCERASEEQPAYLWFFDLDGFKAYNDSFGHLAGDALLTRLGQRLQSTVACHGAVYRLGGDEFCALVTAPVENPLALFEQARGALAETGGAFVVTASGGAVEIPREAREPTQALRIADHHMYRNKTAGRGGAAELVTAVLHAALAQRHPELDEHSSDVAKDVEQLARAVGFDDEHVALAVRAGDLHDVGKLGIPDSIIAKPGPLSEHEWEFMRQHTVMGERIIAAAGPSLEPIAPLVRASHERWDGRGYPDGLAGEEIPLGARIITICDSFRAMLSDRPYKQPMPVAEALQELRRCAGSQFDPELVEVFCRLAEGGALGTPLDGQASAASGGSAVNAS